MKILKPPQVKIVPKAWGREIWMVNNHTENYCGKILEVRKGGKCSLHYHKLKHETFYILEGSICLEIHLIEEKNENSFKLLTAGDVIEVRRRQVHRFEALEDSKIIEISTFHQEEDSYRIDDNIHKHEHCRINCGGTAL
ncbi:MAG: cupin domain-containing protein [Pseudomonadota bacterium]|nr:cupin domain-containing protein [Pseudomonadota bacterium]